MRIFFLTPCTSAFAVIIYSTHSTLHSTKCRSLRRRQMKHGKEQINVIIKNENKIDEWRRVRLTIRRCSARVSRQKLHLEMHSGIWRRTRDRRNRTNIRLLYRLHTKIRLLCLIRSLRPLFLCQLPMDNSKFVWRYFIRFEYRVIRWYKETDRKSITM